MSSQYKYIGKYNVVKKLVTNKNEMPTETVSKEIGGQVFQVVIQILTNQKIYTFIYKER